MLHTPRHTFTLAQKASRVVSVVNIRPSHNCNKNNNLLGLVVLGQPGQPGLGDDHIMLFRIVAVSI